MPGTGPSKTLLWGAAAATAFAAIFFPHLEAVKNKGQSVWEIWPHDLEGTILVPLVIVLTIALFAFVGGWAWSDTGAHNRPAKVGLVCDFFDLLGMLAFFLSAPIIFGGLALALGVEGRRRSGTEGRGALALGAIAVGAVASLVGAAIWVLA